jgi:VacB/RNase II family 3'-5' exoribonuclease
MSVTWASLLAKKTQNSTAQQQQQQQQNVWQHADSWTSDDISAPSSTASSSVSSVQVQHPGTVTAALSSPIMAASRHHKSVSQTQHNYKKCSEEELMSTKPSCVVLNNMPVVHRTIPIRTRRGNIVRIVREQYLRDDLPCHFQSCSICASVASPSLHGSGATNSDVVVALQNSNNMAYFDVDATHYVFPDVYALHRYLELIILSEWTSIVIVQSVLDEFNRTAASPRQYNELRRLIADPRRNVIVFQNEHHRPTYKVRAKNQSRAEYASQALARVCTWYANHLASGSATQPQEYGESLRMVLLTGLDDGKSCHNSPVEQVTSPPCTDEYESVHVCTMSAYLDHYHNGDAHLRQLYAAAIEAEAAKHDAERQQLKHQADLVKELVALGGSTASSIASASAPSSNMYAKYLDPDLVANGIASGILFRGHLKVDKYRAQELAIVDLGGIAVNNNKLSGATEVLISGSQDRNRCIDGDEVVIALYPQSNWVHDATSAIVDASAATAASDDDSKKSTAPAVATAGAAGSEAASSLIPTGRIVAVIERNWRPYVATIREEDIPSESTSGGSGRSKPRRHVMMIPMDTRIPKIRVATTQAAALANQRVVVHIDSWNEDSSYPEGHFVMPLGAIGDLETEVQSILIELDISSAPFAPTVYKQLPDRQQQSVKYAVGDRKANVRLAKQLQSGSMKRHPYAFHVPPEALVGRLDLRESHRGCVCSIDPPGCVDIDDALSVLKLPNGNYQLGVHIADVTYFVPHNSKLDMEARSRGTTVYLVDRRLDMLPTALSEDLCSLRGGVDRLAVSVLWECDSDWRVINTWFGRTVIHNSFALSYDDAQKLVDCQSRPKQSLIDTLGVFMTLAEARRTQENVRILLHAGRTMYKQRVEAGALNLDSMEIRFELDKNTKTAQSIQKSEHLEVHDTIAEFMIAANVAVARRIFESYPSSALLRRHPLPKVHRFEALVTLAASQGLSIDTSSNRALAQSLASIDQMSKGIGDMWIARIVKILATRSMAEAQYISTGDYEVDDFYHYGLAADFYTHFTSPIRRYADVVVHRLLLASLTRDRDILYPPSHLLRQKPSKRQQHALTDTKRDEIAELHQSVDIFGTRQSTAAPFGSRLLTASCDHINSKNRAAKFASKESTELFLSSFLREKHQGERVDAIVFGVRSNGLLVIVPEYEFKTAVLLCDRHGRSVLSPFDEPMLSANTCLPVTMADTKHKQTNTDNNGTESELEERLENARGFECKVDTDVDSGTLCVKFLQTNQSKLLQRTHKFCVFQHVTVDLFVSNRVSRYRRAPPIARLVWSEQPRQAALNNANPNESMRTKSKRQGMRSVITDVKTKEEVRQAEQTIMDTTAVTVNKGMQSTARHSTNTNTNTSMYSLLASLSQIRGGSSNMRGGSLSRSSNGNSSSNNNNSNNKHRSKTNLSRLGSRLAFGKR